MSAAPYTSRKVVAGYLTVSTLFTLAASLIWAINTVFLIKVAGLTLFQVMLVNSIFTVGQMVFEVPTGVIADTIGRRASIVLCMITLIVSTLMYVASPRFGWGIWGFIAASIILGLGYTFQTGAIDAWVVDALDATGWERPKDTVFARGQVASGVGMLVGSVLGGVLGQIDLSLPYLVRAGLLAVAMVAVLLMIRDEGFEPRPLAWSTFGAETRHILDAGVRFGWRSPVVRPLFFVSAISGVFFFYGFYSWQPYVLDLLGRNLVWLLGVVQAGFSAMGIVGNMCVGLVMREGERRRDPAKVLEVIAWVQAALVVGIGAVGIVFPEPGVAPAAIAIAMWLGWGVLFGLYMPVRMAYVNDHIPSKERATVLSLDAFFGDGGAAVGQPALGWLSDRTSVSVGWLVGALFIAISAPLYRFSGRAALAAVEEREAAVTE